jgi:thioredoxin 1
MDRMIFNDIFKNKKKNLKLNKKKPSIIEWPDHIISLDKKDIEGFIRKYPLSIIDFWASWCAPCRAMAPRLRRLSKVYRGEIAFGKLDIQKNKQVAEKYKITGIPNLIFFCNGKKISSITGLKSVGEIKDVIDDVLKKRKKI